ncbi:LamG-like jellyroll fold domain-containing protein [Pseudoalteromonas haloplanktis]|uniref:LamG-like jellyroll fold domain-containing protein n=1 Tax=Pseudoalteromonas haloplanktis TaxID=228 RepID=A0ABU1BHK0_PSEHA|nr:LamG-like jellyroll fold domain-containing protein [Pseudoalteromonas haloplanktis]MDQ9093911.1 LamG-like jellyroll fold domain-containing protein [Pseudoalteromonas haloplanktis]
MKRSEKFAAIREIADEIGTKTATPEQQKKLSQLLKGNLEAQQFFYDYMSMHAQLLSGADSNLEFSYKRKAETAITEEFVIRRKDNADIINDINIDASKLQQKTVSPLNTLADLSNAQPQKTSNKLLKFWIILTALTFLLFLVWQSFNQNTLPVIAEIEQGKISIIGQGRIENSQLFSGEYQVEQDAGLILASGDKLRLTAHTHIKFFNHNEILLTQGKLIIEPVSNNNIILHGPNFTLHSNGGSLTIDLTQAHLNPIIQSSDNTLLIPSRWQPKHFWSFDSQSDRAIDSAGGATGIPSTGTLRTKGLVGQGAFIFDNSANARIDVGSGGGTAPATGSFSVTDGVTIEALIRPEYSGKFKEIDVIFRKDKGDNELRMLLSFQHDQGKNYLRPEGQFNESLSFGLYIVGQGYHELKLPLDGLKGRPTLAQLKQGHFHHVVASYNVSTGLKAIYINGERLASYQYPPGSKILSGGPGQASIGNNPAESRWAVEAFSGIIDEVAFYDFALPSMSINQHFKNALKGHNYFSLLQSADPLPKTTQLPLPMRSTLELDRLTGLPLQLTSQ